MTLKGGQTSGVGLAGSLAWRRVCVKHHSALQLILSIHFPGVTDCTSRLGHWRRRRLAFIRLSLGGAG